MLFQPAALHSFQKELASVVINKIFSTHIYEVVFLHVMFTPSVRVGVYVFFQSLTCIYEVVFLCAMIADNNLIIVDALYYCV